MPLKRLINRKLAKKNASITNQRLKAFNRGNIISLQQSIKGIKTLPNPPINIGIIIKKIIKIPWKVIQELYWREEQIIYCKSYHFPNELLLKLSKTKISK